MTPIKCPPPKIVAVKRSLKSKISKKKNIMDDDDELSNKDDFINDDDSLSSFDAKDLIEFERDEPLIDLSENDAPFDPIRDTVRDKNAKNSSTLLSLLDMLEIGSVTRATETARLGRCAQDDCTDRLPFVSKTSSSSSLQNIPVECPGACAASSGKTDKLSTVFPPLSIQPENPSIVKNRSRHSETLISDDKADLKPSDGSDGDGWRVREGIDVNLIDSALRKSRERQSENSRENFATSVDFDCSIKACSCSTRDRESSNKEKEIFTPCHFNHRNQQLHDVNPKVLSDARVKVQIEPSDTNNNRESVCNQNSVDESSSLSQKDDVSNDCLEFLSPHTSQRKLPPKFYSSTNSLNRDCFEASSRLKRLEERFKGFSYTKKLLRSSKVFSKSEEILSSYGRAKEFKSCDSLNSSEPLASTFSEKCLRQLTGDGVEAQKDYEQDIAGRRRTSSNDEIAGEFLPFSPCTNRHRSSSLISPFSLVKMKLHFRLSDDSLLTKSKNLVENSFVINLNKFS